MFIPITSIFLLPWHVPIEGYAALGECAYVLAVDNGGQPDRFRRQEKRSSGFLHG